MWEHLRRFKHLEPRARGLFLRATALLPVISLSLRMRGFRATQLRLQKYLPNAVSDLSSSSPPGLDGCAALTARMVRSAAYRSLGRATCLEQSLALWWLLGRQGIASSVRIGTRKVGEEFEAHAWVECDGVALNAPEQTHLHYAVFDEGFPILNQAKK
jgi:Transglutaminase-like superfamily